MNFIIKVEGVEPQSQLIIINSKKMTLIDSLEDLHRAPTVMRFIKNVDLITRYQGREVFAEYIGKSRVDSVPMFKIDTFSIDREDKISQILN